MRKPYYTQAYTNYYGCQSSLLPSFQVLLLFNRYVSAIGDTIGIGIDNRYFKGRYLVSVSVSSLLGLSWQAVNPTNNKAENNEGVRMDISKSENKSQL